MSLMGDEGHLLLLLAQLAGAQWGMTQGLSPGIPLKEAMGNVL